MSFTLNGQTLAITINIPADLNLVESEPKSGQYQVKKINALPDGKGIEVVHSDTAEA